MGVLSHPLCFALGSCLRPDPDGTMLQPRAAWTVDTLWTDSPFTSRSPVPGGGLAVPAPATRGRASPTTASCPRARRAGCRATGPGAPPVRKRGALGAPGPCWWGSGQGEVPSPVGKGEPSQPGDGGLRASRGRRHLRQQRRGLCGLCLEGPAVDGQRSPVGSGQRWDRLKAVSPAPPGTPGQAPSRLELNNRCCANRH